MLPETFYRATDTARLKFARASIDERIVIRLALDSLENDPHAFILRSKDIYYKLVEFRGRSVEVYEFKYRIIRIFCVAACDASILVDFWFVEDLLAAVE